MSEQGNITAPSSTMNGAGADASASASAPEIRLFRGRDIAELIPKIQAELGGDAIVVGRRSGLEGGIAGFFQRPFVELEARPGAATIDIKDGERALPEADVSAHAEGANAPGELDAERTGRPARASAGPFERPAAQANGHGEGPLPFEDALAVVQSALEADGQEADQPAPWSVAPGASALTTPATERPEESVEPQLAAPAPAGSNPSSAPLKRHSRAAQRLVSELCASGMSEELAADLTARSEAHVLPLAPRTSLRRALRATLERTIPELVPPPAAGALIVVIGPGGSGKTTLLRALHLHYEEAGMLPVNRAAITQTGPGGALRLDRGDVGCIALASKQARRALERARTNALALIDTPPLSAASGAQIRELAGFLDGLAPERVLVALPATLSLASASRLLAALAPLGANAAAITHADESDQLGVALEAVCRFQLAPELLLAAGAERASLQRIDARSIAERLLP